MCHIRDAGLLWSKLKKNRFENELQNMINFRFDKKNEEMST